MDVDLNWPEIPNANTVTAHFVRDGVSQPVTLTGWSMDSGATFNGHVVSCGRLFDPSVTLTDVIAWWSGGSEYCNGDVQARFSTVEFGELRSSFVWNGVDVDYDVQVPDIVTASPTPGPSGMATPTATVTAIELPRAGGPPASGDELSLDVAALAGAALASGAAFVVARRVRA